MSHFYASVNNFRARTKCTRTGFKESGMEAHIRGWNLGVRVTIEHINGHDIVSVYKTGGSADQRNSTMVYTNANVGEL